MKIIKEFKEFAVKGNMFDMAIGIIIGAAFGKIVNSLVKDVIMPPFGYVMGKTHFDNMKAVLMDAVVNKKGEVVQEAISIHYGTFIQVCLDFIIIAFTIFMTVKIFNRLKKRAEEPGDSTVPTPKDIQLLTEIRDLLAKEEQKSTAKS